MTSQHEPLIAANARHHAARDDDDDSFDINSDREDGDGDAPSAAPDKHPDESPGLFLWLLTFSAGISGLLFGYDTGVISATLVSIGTSLSDRPLSSLDKSVVTSCTSLFALLVSPFASILADALGRKRVILAADGLFITGAVIQALSTTVAGMVIGRSIVGGAVGAASFVIPLYIAELAPAAHRGRLVTMNIVFITLGQVVAYVVGWLFGAYGSEATGWRWMVGLGAVPAAVQTTIVVFMPESPRWLVKAGRSAAARDVIARVSGQRAGSARRVDATLKNIETEVREEAEARRLSNRRTNRRPGWRDSVHELFGIRRNRRALAIACLLQGLQQLCGFNSLMYFSATIFTLVGFPMPTLTSLVVAVTNFAFTLVALGLIDRVGRRRILLWSIPFMIIGLLLAGYGFSFIELSSNSSATRSGSAPAQGAAVVILFSIMLYVAGYAIGLGNVPWMQSELFSLSVRSIGSGIATATNWGANFVIGLTFLLLMDALTPTWTFALYALLCAVGYALIWRVYPETAGLSLEDAASLLEDDNWGVH
ncbi:general substrate transporter [Podospora appendiculata]|uniref:General substrate transporter n=1 Tax=Podospora appendiculata TaxID=314037 RepID=A0AAE0X2Y1_9PEZI|nr:general substrate transporter [Podospora appendiculata]